MATKKGRLTRRSVLRYAISTGVNNVLKNALEDLQGIDKTKKKALEWAGFLTEDGCRNLGLYEVTIDVKFVGSVP